MKFLRKLGTYLQDYTASQPKEQRRHFHRSENLKFQNKSVVSAQRDPH
jgi:hypothetical protein